MVVRIIVALAVAVLPMAAVAEGGVSGIASHVVISEVQTGSANDAGQEFVELYNPTEADIVLDGWQLQYKSATGTSWSKKALLSGSLPTHGFFLLSSAGHIADADGTFASGLSGTAGHVRIVDAGGSPVDTLGWGKSANAPEKSPASAPGAGQSVERAPGWLLPEGGNGADSDDNSQDFIVRDHPEPQSKSSQPEVPLSRPDSPAAIDDQSAAPIVYPPLQITELLPDPASPQTDAADEFIELYNPGSDPVNIGGYVLKAGSNFHTSYVLPQRVLEPDAYLAVYSAASRLSLPNSGGAVQLFSPGGELLDQTQAYGIAKTGQAFAADGGHWSWTLQPTPGDANIMVTDDPSAGAAKKLTSQPSAKPVKVAKPKAAKAAKAKTAKPAAAKKKSPVPFAAALTAADRPSGHWLLLALAGFTLVYILFEFRYDLQNLIYRAKGYRQARRQAGRSAARR